MRVRAWVCGALLAVTVGLACGADGPWERACPEGEGCAEDERCERSIGLPDYEATHSVCVSPCEDAEECPPPGSGNAIARCNDRGLCELRCGLGIACPTEMVCDNARCTWPH